MNVAHHPPTARDTHAIASPKAIERLQTTTLLLSDWNDADPWSGTWEEEVEGTLLVLRSMRKQ